jgi:DNA-directed RNA polymerase subunit H (RpoH/RPB5)
MDPDTIDQIIRSRPTILEILKDRGYNVSSYMNTSPEDILKLANSPQLLKIVATKEDSNDRIVILYWVESSVRLRIETEVNALWADTSVEQEGGTQKTSAAEQYNPETDTIIALLAEPFHPVFDVQSAKQWVTRKARVSFFNMKNLISNPLKHVMQPEFRKLTADEVVELQKRLLLKSKKNLPMIVYHVDMVARVLGLVPGDIVHVRRPSETCGLTDGYRVCVL